MDFSKFYFNLLDILHEKLFIMKYDMLLLNYKITSKYPKMLQPKAAVQICYNK